MSLFNDDVPVTVDFREAAHAQQWTEAAMVVRPWRADFFSAFAEMIAAHAGSPCRVLELGSGPGFLAERLLAVRADLDYVALDFSVPMQVMARERLAAHAGRVDFLVRDLRDPQWGDGLGEFHFIVTHQAVHELRHKRYASGLHAQARERLLPGGSYLVCDHFFGEGGMTNDRLYMTVDEQREALRAAGFTDIEQLLLKGGLVLHQAR
ncbi:class I SAM-dependent methyltransferase [Piscinibacter gummiphilus]|uniref:Class I SAM-dependent methyltransferase n=1 Tax=Piscinibacter gummiphilus TaxID=946333 RepID=A0ABZ0CZ17_9BURK|nr:class I SAM-dependent methyltransferase [Piscinibacter gummiphilus]WOB08232.1 class I SAM-dependent methyltransferase [Piscinibacter gummiphilus]